MKNEGNCMLHNGQLNKLVPIPLYFQLKELIMEEIKNGNYKNGCLIPTEKELSEMFQISSTPIRQAIAELVHEDWLYRVKSKGTFVSKPKINQDFIQTINSFSDQIICSGRVPRSEVLNFEVVTPPDKVMLALNLKPKQKSIYLHRLRFADEDPIVVAKTYLPYESCSFVLSHDLANESLYSILSANERTKIYRIKRSVEAVDSTSYDIKYLNIKNGKAVQQFTTIGYNAFGDIIEYSSARYPGDRNSFEVIVVPSTAGSWG
jgi:GntR family transcriptional regulator